MSFRNLWHYLPAHLKARRASPIKPLAWRRHEMGLTWAEFHALQVVSFAVDVQVVTGALPPDEVERLRRPTAHVTQVLPMGEPTEPMPTEAMALCERDTWRIACIGGA